MSHTEIKEFSFKKIPYETYYYHLKTASELANAWMQENNITATNVIVSPMQTDSQGDSYSQYVTVIYECEDAEVATRLFKSEDYSTMSDLDMDINDFKMEIGTKHIVSEGSIDDGYQIVYREKGRL